MNKGKTILGVSISLILSIAITFLTNKNDIFKTQIPTESYQVYLKGEPIGLIKSDTELYDYIKHKCKMAGLQVEKIITKDAVDTLSARFISKDVNGKVTNIAYPNKVNNVMKLLMNTAAAAGEEIINNEVIEMAGI